MTVQFDEQQIRYHCHLLHYRAYEASIPGKLILAAIGFAEDFKTKLPPIVKHFAIGDIDGMTKAVMELQGTRYGVYNSWGLRRPDLPDGSKGGKEDVVATLAFPVDADADHPGKAVPHAPFKNCVIETSAGNYQEIMILEKALLPAESEPLARALGELTGDKMCVVDISRIMRVPGTLNWPNEAKLKRGRSPDPQPVRVHMAWDGTFTSIEALRAAVANVKPKSTTKTITATVSDAVNGISHDGFRIDEVRWYCQHMAKVWTADERENNPDDFELGKRIKYSFPGQDGLDAFLLLEWGDREDEMKKRWWGKNDFKTEGENLLTLRGLKEVNWMFRHTMGCPCPPAPPLQPLPVGAPLPEGWHWKDGKCARLPAEGLPVPLRTDLRAAIDDLNSKYAFTLLKGSPVVIKEGGKDGIELLTEAAFKAWHRNDLVVINTVDKNGDPKDHEVRIADVWLADRRRRQYAGVDFAPAGDAYPGYYNLWTGWGVEAADISFREAWLRCAKFLDHVYNIICSGNNEHFHYVLAWMADIVQDPARLKGVALVLRGKKGTGKSKVFDILRKVIGRHTITVAHGKQLTGNFNSHIAGKLLIVAEESYWSGDKASEGALKNLITAATATIEFKGKDVFEVPSFVRVGMVTNSEWAVPATADERRYAVFDVSTVRMRDFNYFAAIDAEMDNGGFEALFTLLQKYPLHAVNLRQVPETEALRKQRAYSLEPHDEFVLDMINGLAVGEANSRKTTLGDADINIEKQTIYNAYTKWARERGKSHLLTYDQFCGKLVKATGAKTIRLGSDGDRRQGFKLGNLTNTREHFAKYAGISIDVSDVGLT